MPLNNVDLKQILTPTAEAFPSFDEPEVIPFESNTTEIQILSPEALHGLPGLIVETLAPYTEADPAALLINTLVAFGSCIGVRPFFEVSKKKHRLNLFACLVGDTASGKGNSWAYPKYLFEQVDSEWSSNRIMGGLSSGEGLIEQVRDKRIDKRTNKNNDTGIVTYEDIITDHGVADKRLLVVEQEFSQALKVMSREGNILSPILRQAWDGESLRTMTRNNPLVATGAHISVLSHITPTELLKYISETEQANGFGNRFLWVFVKRSKILSRPPSPPLSSLNSLSSQLLEVVELARCVDEVSFNKEAGEMWDHVYEKLSTPQIGLIGSLTARGHAQVMRLSCIYALMDKSTIIKPSHLQAALALWDYCIASTRYSFGETLGDTYADRILEELTLTYPNPLKEVEIWLLFSNHGKERVRAALKYLEKNRLAIKSKGKSNGGRPPIEWFLAKKAKKVSEVTS